MRILGTLLIVFGVGAIGGGILFFTVIARRAAEARRVLTVPLEANKLTTTESFPVSTARKCQLTANFHRPLTLFPVPDTAEVTYRILDDGGMVLVEDTVKTWQLPRTENQWTSDVEVSYSSDKFSPPRSGKLRLESKMTVGGRTGYTQTEMHIYDTVSDHTERAVYGTALCLVGGVVVLLGGGFLVTCMLQRRPKSSV